MFRVLKNAWKRLSEDRLVFRVMFFNLGLLLTALPVVAFATGTATMVNDGSFHVLLGVLFAAGIFLLHAAILGTDQRLSRASAVVIAGDVWAVLALVTLSIPVTLAIKWWRARHDV